MDKDNFTNASYEILNKIAQQIENNDVNYIFDIEFDNEILKISCDDGIFILNKHTAAQEVWLASPISGPHHFKLSTDGKWVNRDNIEITDIMNKDLNVIKNFRIKIV